VVIFPDVEKILVGALKDSLLTRSETYAQNVHVSTKKPAPDFSPYPSKIVTIRSDGGPLKTDVTKLERVGINVYADAYDVASDLSKLVEALMRSLTGEYIKLVEIILSPVRVDEMSEEEVRYMTLELVVKGSNLS
jgi:hypothetical protein